MTWYAVRTKPGAQMPKREYWTEDAQRSAKGYRIRSGVATDRSAVEFALEQAGFTYYMPVEYVVVRNRAKPNLYDLRRFALLKGYIFVGDLNDGDWQRLLGGYRDNPPGIAGIAGVVSNNGKPVSISTLDLFRLRMYERESKLAAQFKAQALMRGIEQHERQKRKIIVRNARKKLFPGREVKLIWGNKVGRDATVEAWADDDQVRVLLATLDAATETITVPFEFLKAAG